MATEVVERAEPITPLALIQTAIEKGMDPEKLGRLMDLQERYLTLKAREDYARALTAFQKAMPQIPKTRPVYQKNSAEVRYKFAALEDVQKIAAPIMAEHGITATFSQSMNETTVITTVRVQVGSHFEDKPFFAPRPDFAEMGKPLGMSVPQSYGTALTYYRRYAFCAALGIVVCGEDSDAAAEGVGMQQEINEDQVRQLRAMLGAKGKDEDFFCEQFQMDSLAQITQGNFQKAVEWVKTVQAKKNGGGQ